jgi:molecular chaperone GrpE
VKSFALREVSKLTEEKNTLNEDLNNENAELTEEAEAESIFGEAEESADIDKTEGLEEQLRQAEENNNQLAKKLEEAENRLLRLQADFDNFRRRTRLDAEASEKYRAQSLISDLLPALDNFERALKVETEDEQTKSLLQGMEMVYKGLLDALKKEGVEPIESVGKEFDPHLHQAVMQAEDENYGPNTVIDEFQKGYILKDRVIRPSMVKVTQ